MVYTYSILCDGMDVDVSMAIEEVGRCVFCREVLFNSEASIQHSQIVFKKSKIVCGNCLIDLREPVMMAYIAQKQEEDDYKDVLLEKVKDYGWSVNPDTGKLQKIVGTKALNKTQTMGKQRGENNG